MPDVTPICWDPKDCRLRFMRLFYERSGISDSRINRQSARHQPVITVPRARNPWIGQSFAGTDRPWGGVGWLVLLHIGRAISWNGIVTLRAMAMGAPLGVVFYHWGGLQALALIIMGVALVAIALLAIPRSTVKASKGKPLPFRAVFGRVWLYGGIGTGFPPDLALSPPLSRAVL